MGEENAETAYPPPYFGRIDLLAIAFPGTVYHVTGRGNTRQGIVADDRDRSQWLSVLAHVVDRYGWRCHAYCLMVNHYHLLIETPQACCFSEKARLRGSSTRPIGSMGIGWPRLRTAEKNRLRLAARPLQKRVQAHITWLEKELAATNTDLTTMMRESPAWREKEEVLRSVPGVGPVLTMTLCANLPELGTLTRKEVAALAGVAPVR